MTHLDWVALGFVLLLALLGAQEGFLAGALSLAGLVAGAVAGGRLASAFLAHGSHSRYAPMIATAGALLLAFLVQSIGLRLGLFLRQGLFVIPPVRSLDTLGGFLLGGGTACGLGVEGSGWVAGPRTVVTAAHVVAGEHDTTVQPFGSPGKLDAIVVAFEPQNDVAVLRVGGLHARALRLVDARAGAPVAVLGYPEDGPFDATVARIGTTIVALRNDAYGRGPFQRTVTTLRGNVRHGDSGGPAVDAAGAVETTVFASRIGGGSGFGVPSSAVRNALQNAKGPVSTGPCAS